MYFVEILLTEAKRPDGHEWHRGNTKDILHQLDSSMLKSIIVTVLQNTDYHRREVAADLVEFVPGLAICMIDLLGAYRAEPFDKYLRSGIMQMGDKALLQLNTVLKQGSISAKESAIEVLVNIGTPLALGEVAAVIEGENEDLVIRALTKLSGAVNARIIPALQSALTHRSAAVRDAAVSAISRIRDASAIPFLISLAERTSIKMDNADERIAAVRVLGEIGGKNELPTLEKIANSSPLLGKRRYEEIRQSAEESVLKIRDRLSRDGSIGQGER